MKRFINISLGVVFCLLFTTVSCKQKAAENKTNTYQNISVDQAINILKEEPDVVFLDVRTPEETAEGMIVNADTLNFRASGFESKLSELDKDKSYVVYCRSGRRSANASKMMEDMGFKNVQNMEGGYLAWEEKNK